MNINFNPTITNFKSTPKVEKQLPKSPALAGALPTYALAFFLLSATAPTLAQEISSKPQTEQVAKNITALSDEDLENAPSPVITVAGKEINAGIVVDVTQNKLYRYDANGDVIDGYRIASGVKDKNGESITTTGISKVTHIETYPYSTAPAGSVRRRIPKAFGPKILYLTSIDPKTGRDLGSNGEFIHGNNDASSIGKFASHGCMRMDNDVIRMFAEQVKPGTYVNIIR